MARIVLIAAGTLRQGINNLNDVVAIHEDGIELGPAYDTFKIVDAPGVTIDPLKYLTNENRDRNGKYAYNLTLLPADEIVLAQLPGVAQDKINLIASRANPNA